MVYQKLQDEIDATMNQRKLISSEVVEDFALKRLPYLQACISESLRTYPPIFQLRERIVPPEGMTILGYRIPGGTFVGLNSLAKRFQGVYGEFPDKFQPERWLIEDKEHLKLMYRYLELVFGYGSSKCLGVNLASMEVSKIVFEVSHNHQISYCVA